MRAKLPRLITGALITVVFALVPISLLYAYDEVLDQSQESHDICSIAYSQTFLNQTFQPTENVLTKVEVKMLDKGGVEATLTIRDEVTGGTVAQVNRRMLLGDGWEEFLLVGDGLGYVLDTDHLHSITVATEMSGRGAPCWLFSDSDAYAYGSMRYGYEDQTGDLTFRTYGYSIDMGREDDTSTDPGDDDGGVDETPGNTDTTPVEETTTLGEIPDNPVTVEETTEEVDESVEAPELGSVLVDDVVQDVEDDTAVEVEPGQKVKVTGTATPGDVVTLFIGDEAYEATADEDGNWYVLFDTTDLEEDDYTIQAQSKDSEDKVSEKVDLFMMKLGTVAEDVEDTAATVIEEEKTFYEKLFDEYKWYTIGVLAIATGGLILLFLFFAKKRKKKEEKKGENTKESKG